MDTISEDAIMENLKLRYKKDKIYVRYFVSFIHLTGVDLYWRSSCLSKSVQGTFTKNNFFYTLGDRRHL